jgi:hypothetical protein
VNEMLQDKTSTVKNVSPSPSRRSCSSCTRPAGSRGSQTPASAPPTPKQGSSHPTEDQHLDSD